MSMEKEVSMEEENDVFQQRSAHFLKKLESDMDYKSEFNGDLMSFDWVDEIEFACPRIDIIVRNPKLTLIKEENLVKVERAKKITVDSVKDLAKHSQYISRVNKKTKDVEPSKILDVRNEETYNIYENRFLYTLIQDLEKFIFQKEKMLEHFELNNNKQMEYKGNSTTEREKIQIELKISSSSLPSVQDDKKLKEEIEAIKKRIKRIKEFLSSWEKSEMYKELDKAHVTLVKPPLKKTNILLKNPNFRIAVRLWDIIRMYDYEDNDVPREEEGNGSIDVMKGFLDHSFFIDYLVLDSMTKSKREQRKRMSHYAVILLTEEMNRVLALLKSSGIKVSEEELLAAVAKKMKEGKSDRLVGMDDVKKKFKSALEEYLERTKQYL